MKRKVLQGAISVLVHLLGLRNAGRFTAAFLQSVSPIHRQKYRDQEYILYCPNEITLARAQTYFDKEPDTIEWIDQFGVNEVLLDVGANIGLYSIYAAKKNVRVIALEPEAQNFALLNRNIFLNSLANQMIALNLAVADRDAADYLFLPEVVPGGALNTFGEAVDLNDEAFASVFKQGVISFTLDSFLEKFPEFFPDHIKIDVDGLESKIVKSGTKTFKNPKLKSVLIEINEALPRDLELISFISDFGFKLKEKRGSPTVQGIRFKDIKNYIFVRQDSQLARMS